MTASTVDQSGELQREVQEAIASRTPLAICGNGSKAFYGRKAAGRPLTVSRHHGIVGYEPSELVATARAGTTLDALEARLEAENQMLGFEPPRFGPEATLGGSIACGFSGPRRPFAGSARDFVLGCKLINGAGEVVSFGGQVMKNVAGFDLSRLMVGALGTLGVLLEISLKVLPRPESEVSLSFACPQASACERMLRWASAAWPISGLAYDGRLHVRLSGAEAAVRAAQHHLGGDAEERGSDFWSDLKEHKLPFFLDEQPLWRISVPPAAPFVSIDGTWLIDWGGAQRWLKTAADADAVFAAAEQMGGHATLFRARGDGPRVQPMPAGLQALHRRLKDAFDPHRIFNVGRMDPAW